MTKNVSGTQIHCEITNDSNPKMNHTKSSTTKTKDKKKYCNLDRGRGEGGRNRRGNGKLQNKTYTLQS